MPVHTVYPFRPMMKFRIVARSVTLICLGEYSGHTASSAKKKLPSSPCSYWMNGNGLRSSIVTFFLPASGLLREMNTCSGARNSG